MRLDFWIFFFLNVLKVDINLFLFETSFKWFISKLFSFESFLIVSLKDRVITINEVIDKNERFFDINILLSL